MVEFRRGKSGRETLRALDGMSLEVRAGERVAVIGASGAGKSTLFRALTRSVPLTAGVVRLGGENLYALGGRELRRARRGVGVVHQAYNLVPQLPAGMNVALGEVGRAGNLGALRTLLFGPGAAAAERGRAALERVGLGEQAATRTADLSGGQQQRVAVARLLVQRPALILADEPFAAVDPVTTERILRTLLELNEEGATLLVNLHDVELARRFFRIIGLRRGRVVFDGHPRELTEDRLQSLYAGEAREAEPDEDPGRYRRPGREAQETELPTPVVRGQDGNSAH